MVFYLEVLKFDSVFLYQVYCSNHQKCFYICEYTNVVEIELKNCNVFESLSKITTKRTAKNREPQITLNI